MGIAVAIYLARDYWHDTVLAYYLGRTQLAAERYGFDLPTVDEVEILALGGEAAKGQPDSFPADFGPPASTLNRHTVQGDEAEAIAKIWRLVPTKPLFRLLWCHRPYYALRFRAQGKLLLETSVCWHCGTYSLPVKGLGTSYYGFDAKSEKAQTLLATLTEYAPHPEPAH